MRFYFQNLDRPKKAAKRITALLSGKALHQAQHAVAVASGYADWHELEKGHNSSPPSPLDQDLSIEDFRDRIATMINRISRAIDAPDGDVQYAVSHARLTGDRPFTFDDHETIRTEFWRASPMPWLGKYQVGATFFTKDKGEPPERAYQKQGDPALHCVADGYILGLRVREESRVPRVRMKDFVPHRLWLPYGWWTCKDGSEVLFSRDYKPMWRIRVGMKPERLAPWLWIHDRVKDNWFGTEGRWRAPTAIASAKLKLEQAGISGLPILADALPSIVNHGRLDADKAVENMEETFGRLNSYYASQSPHRHLGAASFREYVLNHPPTESWAGDFFVEARRDHTFPDVRTWRDLELYLQGQGAIWRAIEAARVVWKAFKAQTSCA